MNLEAHFDVRFAEIETAFLESHHLPPTGQHHKMDSAFHSPVSTGQKFLSQLGLNMECLAAAQERARDLGLDISQVLCGTGLMSEHDYYKSMADFLNLSFIDCPVKNDNQMLTVPTGKNLHRMARAVVGTSLVNSPLSGNPAPTIYLAPDLHELPILSELLNANPNLGQRIRISRRSSNKDRLINRGKLILLSWSRNALNSSWEALSAKKVITATQSVLIFFALQVLVFWWVTSDGLMQIGLHLLLSSCFAAGMILRLLACIHFSRRSKKCWNAEKIANDECVRLPVYSILVALYHEANQVDELVDSLLQLDWPWELLEIKVVCEAEDELTIAACRACIERVATSSVALVIVPDAQPRTKPKALNYALPLCQGEFVVVYDAEDRPDKNQLKEAFHRFRQGPTDLACLQAPLAIHNHGESLWSALFAVEYSAHFDGLLPALENLRLPFPLGGTSNHFRRTALTSIGAWDPYNVTEDADLGIRLARSGCRAGTLTCPTYEEAPIRFNIWLGQRTRWFKGWFQTWLVHMRHPVRLTRELGLRGSLAFHVLITGMLISLILHPFLYYHLMVDGYLLANGQTTAWRAAVLGIDTTTLVLTYLSVIMLALKTLPLRQLSTLSCKLWLLPAYWLVMSLAAWCALWELCRRPHHWQKTPHRSFCARNS
ncbi:MAG: glycosyltransferase [Rhizobiaceae bacterium]